MATIHLELDGIPGDSEAANYEGQIDCSSWAWGASQAANMHVSTGGAAAGSNVMDISITKDMDKASPNLMKYCCKGTVMPTATLTCTKSGGDGGTIEWLKVTMTNAIISNISSSGQEGSMGMESVGLNFSEYKMEFWPQDDTGAQEAAIEAEYNIRTQT